MTFTDGHICAHYYCKTHAPLYGKGSFVDHYGEKWGHGPLVDVDVERIH